MQKQTEKVSNWSKEDLKCSGSGAKASELDGVMVPEVRVRNNLWARFSRNAYYQISELATEQSDGSFAIQSGGRAFVVG